MYAGRMRLLLGVGGENTFEPVPRNAVVTAPPLRFQRGECTRTQIAYTFQYEILVLLVASKLHRLRYSLLSLMLHLLYIVF